MKIHEAIKVTGILSENWVTRCLLEFMAANDISNGDPSDRTSKFLDRMSIDHRTLSILDSLPGCLPNAVATNAAQRALEPSAIEARIDAVFSENNWPLGKPSNKSLATFTRHVLEWLVAEQKSPIARKIFTGALANLAAHAWRTPDGNQMSPDSMCTEVEQNIMLPGGAAKLSPLDLHHLGVGYMIPLVHGFRPEETAREHMYLLSAYASRTNFIKLSDSQVRLYEPRLKAMAAVAIFTEAVSLIFLMRAADYVSGTASALETETEKLSGSPEDKKE